MSPALLVVGWGVIPRGSAALRWCHLWCDAGWLGEYDSAATTRSQHVRTSRLSHV